MHDLVCFANDIRCLYFIGGRIDRNLAGDEQQVVGLYGLTIGPDGGRRVGGIDDLFFHGSNIGEVSLQTMKIVIITKTPPPVLFPAAAADCITVPSLEELAAHQDADLFVDLDFEVSDARLTALDQLLPAPVIINAVIPTLAEIQRPFIRINGWPGFLDRELHELSASDAAAAQVIGKWYEKLGRSYRLAPDIPGMITARILATIINEAWYTWEAGVSTKEEIDTAMKLGTNYPRGPFEWGQQVGLTRIVSLLDVLGKDNARYMPANSLQRAVNELKCD